MNTIEKEQQLIDIGGHWEAFRQGLAYHRTLTPAEANKPHAVAVAGAKEDYTTEHSGKS